MKTTTFTPGRIVGGIALFLFLSVVLDEMSDHTRGIVLPILMFAIFVRAAIKSPPIAIMILLYYSMISGGWFILLAAPITILLARRYQRQRLELELNPDHIRRTVLLGLAAMAATLPFTSAALGAWSQRGAVSPERSASPLVDRSRSGQNGALQRFARWLGFGSDGPQGQPGQLQPFPTRPQAQPPDDPFNWWLLLAAVAIVLLLLLAWWLWRRRNPTPQPVFMPTTAVPLARLEAVGERIGRPRRSNEGPITYGRVLAGKTGDARLAAVGPMVSNQVYQSAKANPRQVGDNLTGIEETPPPLPPKPTSAERFAAWRERLPSSRALGLGLAGVIALVLAGWLIVPRLDRLQQDRFESGLEQLQVVPLAAEHVDNF